MNRIIFTIVISFSICRILYAQEESTQRHIGNIGIDVQGYPTGAIVTLRYEHAIKERHAVNVRAGYNIIRHRNLGVQDDERGGGGGFSLGYRFYLKEQQHGFFFGAKSDVWFNEIQWKSSPNNADERSGITNIIVLQPTAEAGYCWAVANNQLGIAPYIALGSEINVMTKGEEVGQGAIFLVGLNVHYRFSEAR